MIGNKNALKQISEQFTATWLPLPWKNKTSVSNVQETTLSSMFDIWPVKLQVCTYFELVLVIFVKLDGDESLPDNC